MRREVYLIIKALENSICAVDSAFGSSIETGEAELINDETFLPTVRNYLLDGSISRQQLENFVDVVNRIYMSRFVRRGEISPSIQEVCPRCNSDKMKWDGQVRLSEPPKYAHQCEDCGNVEFRREVAQSG